MATNDSIPKFFISKQWKGGFFWCPSHRKSHRKGTDSMFILRSLVSSGTLLGWITMKYYLQYMIYISCISEIIYQFFSIFTAILQLYYIHTPFCWFYSHPLQYARQSCTWNLFGEWCFANRASVSFKRRTSKSHFCDNFLELTIFLTLIVLSQF